MIYTLYLILFIISVVLIFLTNNIYYLIGFIIYQLILILIKRICIKDIYRIIKSNLILLITVLLFNTIFMNVLDGLLLFFKLFIVIIATYINKYIITNDRLILSLEHIFFFSKNKENISLIITMSLSLIPILNKMIHNIRISLKSRNYNFTLKNIIIQGYIMFISFINQIFKKTNEIELSLISRGFNR